jgi:RNA polymerase sigma-70 factor (ECF subfamily)
MGLSATRWTVIQAAQAGEEEAVRRLCAKYWPAVVAYLRRRGVGDEAEDVAQESFVALLRSALSRAQPSAGRFRGLVFAIARNQLGKHLERQGALKRGGGQVVQSLGDRDVAAEQPDEAFDREWLSALLRAGLAQLAREHPDQFEALRRFVLEGQPQAQIARELGVSVGVVKKRVHRGKRRLAAVLRKEVWRYACSPGEYEAELAYLAALLDGHQPTG